MVIEIGGELNFDGQSTLNLDCYSYQRQEFEIVTYVLKRSDAEYEEKEIPKDKDARIGTRFILLNNNISKVEKFLKISFFPTRSGHNLRGQGASYSCKRVEVLGSANGCETIYADDDYSAKFICAMVAKKRKWFSGEALRGACKE